MISIAILAGTFLRSQDLLQPWEDGHRGSCAALFGLMARNHLRYGLTSTGGLGVLNQARSAPESFHYYTHHPQGCVLLATLGASVGGTRSGIRLIFLPLAIGIVLLIYRLARDRGRGLAAVAGAFAALAPLGVYYGAFVNFEVPTLFFTLLALHLFLRHRRRGRTKDFVRASLAAGAAVYCDWIAIGLPLTLMVLLPFMRDGASISRRRGSWKLAGVMLGAVVLSAAFSLLTFKLQTGRYGTTDSNLPYFLSVTPFGEGFDWALWAERMLEHVRTLVGAPLAWMALAGLAVLLWKGVRRRLDSVDVAAATMATIGLTNVVLLGAHAAVHDYYLLYLLPAICLLAASILPLGGGDRRAERPRTGAALAGTAVAVALSAWLVFQSARVLEERRSFTLAEMGQKINEVTKDGWIVFLGESYFTLQVPVAADRHVDFAPDLRTLELRKARARYLGQTGKPMVLLVAKEREEALDPAFKSYLETESRRVDRGPFAMYRLGLLD